MRNIMLDLIKKQTATWLKSFIILFKICPFAARVVEQDMLRYHVDTSDDLETNLQTLIDALLELDRDDSIDTTLLIYATAFANFEDFLDYLTMANQLLVMQGYEGTYQLASFHPHYCFAGATETDAANYTNRSPYPMLHILREDSIEQALAHYPHPEKIPERNIQFTRELGLEKLQALLDRCKQK
jgi:uncharacterized protein